MPLSFRPGGGAGGGSSTPGKSAYQSWLDVGNSGTEAQFVASLKGAKGDASTVAGPTIGRPVFVLDVGVDPAAAGVPAGALIHRRPTGA